MKFLALVTLSVAALASPTKEINTTLEKRGAVLTGQFSSESEVFLFYIGPSHLFTFDSPPG